MALSLKNGRKNFSKKTEEFFANFFKDEDEVKENLVSLMDGTHKALKVKEANIVLKAVLLALTIDDGNDDIEIIPNPTDESKELPEDETLSQLNKSSNDRDPKLSVQGTSGEKIPVSPKPVGEKKVEKKLCRFYQNGI